MHRFPCRAVVASSPLRTPAIYITKLPKAEHEAAKWQSRNGIATSGGPTMFARIGIVRALNAGKPDAAPMPRCKGAKAYKVIR
jgi:hypothetical protein